MPTKQVNDLPNIDVSEICLRPFQECYRYNNAGHGRAVENCRNLIICYKMERATNNNLVRPDRNLRVVDVELSNLNEELSLIHAINIANQTTQNKCLQETCEVCQQVRN